MKALIVVDMQNDFMPGGPLGVKGADTLIPLINKLMPQFPLVVASLDFHPKGHCSFASSHPGKKAGDMIIVGGVEQILWPDHCIQNTKGAELADALQIKAIAHFSYKGTDKDIDSYSVFFDNARQKKTGLDAYLKSKKATDLYFCGVATDYCVLYSSLDAIDLGFSVHVIADACRGIDVKKGDTDRALSAIVAKGGKIVY